MSRPTPQSGSRPGRLERGTVLGLVGPVCAGKSEVSRRLGECGAEVFAADAAVRGLYELPEVQEAVRKLFGDGALDASGKVDRSVIAARVFGGTGGSDLLKRLTEEVIFPRTGRLIEQALERFRAVARPGDVLVLDAPTLFEAKRTDWCDCILLVSAPLEFRRAWASARGWPEGELQRRDAAMLPESAKRRRADYVIENTGTIEDLREAAAALWRRLQAGN